VKRLLWGSDSNLIVSFLSAAEMRRLNRTLEGVRLTALDFRLESRPSFYYKNGIHELAPPAKKPQAKTQTVKKQIPVKKITLTESRSS
jgi:hypothetical protein